MRGNRRAVKRITAVLMAVTVLLAAWVFPAFAEGTAAAGPTDTTQESTGAEEQAEPNDDEDSVATVPGADEEEPEEDGKNGEPEEPGEKPDGASGDDAGKSGLADSVRSKPDQPLTLGASGFLAASATVSGTEVTVHLDNPGDLQTEILTLSITEGQITKLIITGDMNGADMDYIWDNGVGVMTALTDLDMSGATYRETGGRLKANQFRINSKLETFALPSGVQDIADDAFHTCTALRSIDFSSCTGLTSIGDRAFENCTSLERVDLSACASLLYIGESAFKGCISLERVNLPDSVLAIVDYTFQGCTALTDVRFPASLQSIGSNAFDGSFQGSLASIDLSGCRDLMRIGPRAFYNCTNLVEITFPTGLTAIMTGAFENSGIERADLSGNANLLSLNQEVFRGCSGLQSVDLSDTGIISIEVNTFYNCTALETIFLPDRMVSITANAFESCSSLQTITFPAGLISIGDNAFDGCTRLETVNARSCTNLTTIGNNAFIHSALQFVDLSFCTSLTSIGSGAFSECGDLETIWMPNTTGIVGVDSSTFSVSGGRSTPVEIIVPTALFGSYQADSDWSTCEAAGDVELKGGWTITINQAVGGHVEASSKTSLEDSYVTLFVDVLPGYTHTGWSTTPGGLNLIPHGNDEYGFMMPAQNVTITPTFQMGPTTFPVTYHANGGTGSAPTEGDKAAGATFAAAANTFTAPTGHYFKEWNTQADGTGAGYPAGATVTMPNGTLDLYAIWDTVPASSHTVTYHANGFAGTAPGAILVLAGSTHTIEKPTGLTAPDGKQFKEWNTLSDGTGTTHMPDNIITVNGNLDLYAIWENVPATSSGSSSRSDGSSTPDRVVAKTVIPASAFAWDGDRTLTIDYERITPLGLMSVRWDGVETKEYSVHAGSVIVRFAQDFIDSQAPGEHTVRVEFLNHTGETTVNLGANVEPKDADIHNPNTGGDTQNPQTGDLAGHWRWLAALIPAAAIMTGSGMMLVRRRGNRL